MKKFFSLCVILLLLFSCIDPSNIDKSEGTLSILIDHHNSSRFSTIIPELDVDRYVVDFISYNGEPSGKNTQSISESGSSVYLAAGVWELRILAENSSGSTIAESEIITVTISANIITEKNVLLSPSSGTGTLNVTLDLSKKPADTVITEVEYSVLKGLSPQTVIGSGVLNDPYRVNLALDTGTDYRLKFIITTDSSTVISEGAFHVYKDVVTAQTVSLSESDFSGQSVIIADHSSVLEFENIPAAWITEVKKMLLLIGGESHGRAYNYGLDLLAAENPTYAVSTQFSGTPEAYTDQNLRSTRTYRFGNSWLNSMGEEECFTNTAAVNNMKTGLTYMADNYSGKIIQGFGWCWDMTWRNSPSGTQTDSVYGCRWAGSTAGGPEGGDYGLAWGLDNGDAAMTGNSINMQTYLDTVEGYNTHEPGVTFIYTTGPVDGNHNNETGYQRHLKHEYIRDYVNTNGGVLFDFADILSWDYDNNQSPGDESWTDGNSVVHTWRGANNALATGGDGFDAGEGGCHISDDACKYLAKAMWWMLARVAGWDGN